MSPEPVNSASRNDLSDQGAALPRPPVSPRGIVYLGSPPEAVAPLRALVEAGHRVDLVVSAPDRRRKRRGEPTPTPVKAAALELGLKVTDDLADVESAVDEGADLGVVVAFGQLLRLPLLTRLAMVNLHFSLLPRWRGAAPVQRAILAGDACTGATTFRIVRELDSGPIYRRLTVPIEEHETSGQLLGRLAELGAGLLLDSLDDIEAGRQPSPQPTDGMTLAPKIHPDDVRIDWTSNHEQIDRLIRAATVSYTHLTLPTSDLV